MNILIVEDELLIQKSLAKLLEKRGISVTCESTGLQAINRIKQESYDRIICDLMLQDITGFDVIESAKERYTIHEIEHRFIIMTAYSSSQVLEKARQYGCLVLNKPFSNIKETIDTFINGKNNE